MDINQFVQVQQEAENLANYYRVIDFSIIASSFQRVAEAMKAMIATIQEYECRLKEQGKEDGQ